jgi:hypothetical protein
VSAARLYPKINRICVITRALPRQRRLQLHVAPIETRPAVPAWAERGGRRRAADAAALDSQACPAQRLQHNLGKNISLSHVSGKAISRRQLNHHKHLGGGGGGAEADWATTAGGHARENLE